MSGSDYTERRLKPSRHLPEFHTLEHLLCKIREIASILQRSHWNPPIRVLDAGAGSAPYRSLFPAPVFDYVAVDSQAMPGLSSQADGVRLPFRESSFDLVLSNQVLEHVTDPGSVARELRRVLNERGYLLVSCPFVWEVHNFPADYWRFSSQALKLLFGEMDLLYVDPSTSTAQCLAQTFNLFVNRNWSGETWKRMLFRFTNSQLLTRLLPSSDSLLPANYVMLARKFPRDGQASSEPLMRMHIDAPCNGTSISTSSIKVSGWVASDAPLRDVSARIDNSVPTELQHSLPRLDVWRAFPEYRYAHRSGFAGEYASAGLPPGEHRLTIEARVLDKSLSESVRIHCPPG